MYLSICQAVIVHLFVFFQRIQIPVWSQKDLVWAQAHWWHGCSGLEIWRRLCLGLQELWWRCAVWLCCARYEMFPVLHWSRLSSLLWSCVISSVIAKGVTLGLRTYYTFQTCGQSWRYQAGKEISNFTFTRKSIEYGLCSCNSLSDGSSYQYSNW